MSVAAESARTHAPESGLLVLVINAGSSNVKLALRQVYGERQVHLWDEELPLGLARERIASLNALFKSRNLPAPQAVAHRVVHGGPTIRAHGVLTPTVRIAIEAAKALAPLHNSIALEFVDLAQRQFGALPQVACFDTVFHQALPDAARVLPVGEASGAAIVRRYGFHGLSCESVLRQLEPAVPERLVIAHLGAGASVTAVRSGRSIDTTMGLTPSGGLVMGTRSGDIDPGVVLYLLRQLNLDANQLQDYFDRRAGLLALSGVSGDMRELRELSASNARARLAIEVFCQSVRKQLAAMVTVLGGVDMIVFTGGIGEHDAATRADICRGLNWMSIVIDPVRNAAGDTSIGAPESRCAIRVVPSDENTQIARHAYGLLSS